MKKLYLLAALTLLVVSCQKDDEMISMCETPSNISANSITATSATIYWSVTNNGNENTSNFTLEYGISGFELGTGISNNVTISNLSSNPDGGNYELTNLLPSTSYDVYIQRNCSSENESMFSNVFSFSTLAPVVVTEFRPNLTELNIFQGSLRELTPSPYAFEYDLNTRLFTDYAHKQRLIFLPEGTSLVSNGDGLPEFPENTLIAKTFYYNIDERDMDLGRKIIETRILIKVNGIWQSGDYIWNDSQTDATLDINGSVVPITWTDLNGTINNINYQIPSNTDCFTCHQTNNTMTPIGPKLRSLNFNVNGINQLQQLKDMQWLTGVSSPSSIAVLPNWEDTSATLEQRARAYFDVQCAHCHSDGGFCEIQSTLRLSYETSLSDSKIAERKNSISSRISTFDAGVSMPFIGTTILHTEGVSLIQSYLDTL